VEGQRRLFELWVALGFLGGALLATLIVGLARRRRDRRTLVLAGTVFLLMVGLGLLTGLRLTGYLG
jgi:hypothetical protein